jgi:hypothetical protein
MRMRAYRPEVPGYLEDRSLLSGVAGLSADPVVLLRDKFIFAGTLIRQDFDLYVRYRDLLQLRDELDDAIALIPFGRVDGLPASIDRIVERMKNDLVAHVPHALLSARNDALAVTRAVVEARVRAGDVVVR